MRKEEVFDKIHFLCFLLGRHPKRGNVLPALEIPALEIFWLLCCQNPFSEYLLSLHVLLSSLSKFHLCIFFSFSNPFSENLVAFSFSISFCCSFSCLLLFYLKRLPKTSPYWKRSCFHLLCCFVNLVFRLLLVLIGLKIPCLGPTWGLQHMPLFWKSQKLVFVVRVAHLAPFKCASP